MSSDDDSYHHVYKYMCIEVGCIVFFYSFMFDSIVFLKLKLIH